MNRRAIVNIPKKYGMFNLPQRIVDVAVNGVGNDPKLEADVREFVRQNPDLDGVPRCPACGSKNIEVCNLLGHLYPVKRKEEI